METSEKLVSWEDMTKEDKKDFKDLYLKEYELEDKSLDYANSRIDYILITLSAASITLLANNISYHNRNYFIVAMSLFGASIILNLITQQMVSWKANSAGGCENFSLILSSVYS
jgi:hypothetical protein